MNFGYLRQRASLLEKLRAFFRDRDFLEVETPLLAREAIPETHIDLSRVGDDWLQASPEMHHKRLLCAGSGPIFEITRSFRRGEAGQQHRPEFTIVEWYRPGDGMSDGMGLLEEVVHELLGTPPATRTTYRQAFQDTIGIDPHRADEETLSGHVARLTGRLEAPPPGTRDEALNTILALAVEPELGRDRPEFLYHYPASQAALATVTSDAQGVAVAERFELYFRGLELANGYHELTDAAELRRRLTAANAAREARGAEPLPMPERLLADMESPGLPPCAGVALGFDRLVMLATGAETIDEVRAF